MLPAISIGQTDTWCPALSPMLDGSGGSVGAIGVTSFRAGNTTFDLTQNDVTFDTVITVGCEQAAIPPIFFLDQNGNVIGFQRLFLMCVSCEESGI